MQLAFKNWAPLTKFITKTDGTTIDGAENVDLVMPMYNPTEYSSNFLKQQNPMVLFKRWSK